MRRMGFLWVMLAVGAAQPVFGTTFPQLALGGLPGAGESYECVIMITNETNQVWSGQMVARQGNHDPWTIRWVAGGQNHDVQSVTFDLAAGGTIKVVARSITGELGVGYLVLEGRDGASDTDVTVSFFYNLRRTGGDLLDSVSVPPPYLAQGAMLPAEYVPDQIDTGIAWSSSLKWNSEFNLTFELRDVAGAVVETREMPFTGQQAMFVSQIFPETAALGEFIGRVYVSCPHGIFVTALRLEHNSTGFQLTGTPSGPIWSVD